MTSEARESKALDALIQNLRAITSCLARLFAALSLGSASIAVCQALKLQKPRSSTPWERIENLAKRSVIAAACALIGVASALADSRVTVIAATGGEAMPATTANGAWTALTGPTLMERDAGAINGNGTMILTAPTGFEFNQSASVTVLVQGGTKNINGVPDGGTIPVSVTATSLTLTITSKSAGDGNANTLTFQNIQVRPTASTPLARGNITESGTCGFKNLTLASGTWGFLREVAGSLAAYRITGTDCTTAGSPTSIMIQKVDQFSNPVSDRTAKTLIFSGCRTVGAYAPVIGGSQDAFTTGIPVTFDCGGSATVTLVDYRAETAILNVTDGMTSSTTGLSMSVVAGPASSLTCDAETATVTYGASFSVAAHSIDQYGNPSATGLGSSVIVTLTMSSGAGRLLGTLPQDIGTSAGKGTANFTGLKISAAGTGQVLRAGADGFTSGSTTVNVLPLLVAPNIVVGNKTYDGANGAPIIGRSLTGVLGGDDVSLDQSGLAAFADKHVGAAKPVTVTGLSLTGSAAANYRLSTTSLSAAADITPRPVMVSATPDHRTYDGTTVSVALPTLCPGGLASGDACALSQHFGDKHVGTGKLLIPSGSINDGNGGNNYAVNFVNNLDGVISAKGMTVMGITASDKIYDGTVTATLDTAGASLMGLLPLDAVHLDTTGVTGAFSDPNVGSGKTVLVSGLTIGGADAGNYTLTQPTTTADITPPVVAISGTVGYCPVKYAPGDLPAARVGNVTMTVTGAENPSVITLVDGSYDLNSIPAGGTYCVTPSKTDDSAPANGVTVADLALIQASVLGKRGLDPYQKLAADVNSSGNITVADLALVQALVLGKRTNFPAGLWRFIPADYVFPDTNSPWSAPSQRWYTNQVADVANGDFIAIKRGDVNHSWIAPAGGNSLVLSGTKGGAALAAAVPEVVFGVSRQSARPGQTVTVPITVSGFSQVSSAQFSLAWDPAVLRYLGTGSYGLKGLSAGSFGTAMTESGKLAFAWYDQEAVGVTLADGTVLFTVSFEVIGKPGSVSAVALAGTPTAEEASVDFGPATFKAEDGSVAVVEPLLLENKPRYANGAFRLSVPTETGRSYVLEFTDALAPAKWTPLPAVTGDGTVAVLVDPAATNQQRFYRVSVH
jgi:hypothetical protein